MGVWQKAQWMYCDKNGTKSLCGCISFLLLGLFDVLQYFARAVGAVPPLAPLHSLEAFPRNSHEVVIGVNPNIGQHLGSFWGCHVTHEQVPRAVVALLNRTQVGQSV